MKKSNHYALKATFLLLILIFFTNDLSSQEIENKIKEIKEEQEHVKPCEIITESEIRSYFDLDASLDIQWKDSDLPYPTCNAQWTLGTKVKRKLSNGMEYETDVWNRYMLVLVDGVGPSAFDAGISRYKDPENVNIGDRAVWSSKKNQITVLTGDKLFHLNVYTPDFERETKEMVMELAKMTIERLKE